jgi:hypothetical protein
VTLHAGSRTVRVLASRATRVAGAASSRLVVVVVPALLLAVASAGVSAADEPPAEPVAPDPEVLTLPLTIDGVWCRADGREIVGRGKTKGDLSLTDEAVEIHSRKKAVSIPLDDVRRVSFGKMRGDVDTDWAILTVATDGPPALVGLRDGRKMGYGTRSREIYETLRSLVRQTGTAQYAVPDDMETFDVLDGEFTMAVPRGWTAHHESLIESADRMMFGTVVFSPGDDDPRSIFVERRESPSGADCSGLTDKARDRVLASLSADPRFDGISHVAQADPTTIDGCEGLRLVGREAIPGGGPAIHDLRVVSDGRVLFLFGASGQTGDGGVEPDAFERALSTVRFSAAR